MSTTPGSAISNNGKGPVLRLDDLTMHYSTRQGWVKAVDGVSFELARGESLGLVGESGCGKTSLALCLLKVLPDNAHIVRGKILLKQGTGYGVQGELLAANPVPRTLYPVPYVDLTPLNEDEMRRYRWTRISMVFQAAMSSLNPVQRVGNQLVEVIQTHERIARDEARGRVAELFQMVGLEPALMERYPHELSGGMKQRAVIALALACKPDVIIADEPTTALDVIVQYRVLQELRHVQAQQGTAMIYISHDLGVIAEVSARIAVMYAGKIVEMASTADLFHHPRHPYTIALMSSFPNLQGPKRELVALEGDPPDLVSPPVGCRFNPRCPNALQICREQEPPLEAHAQGHLAACWNPVTPRVKP
jgi:peptide/nickel transport system ATP-binding protein